MEAALTVNSATMAKELGEKFNVNHITILCELKKFGKIFSVWKISPT